MLLYFSFNKSFLKILIKIAIGVTTKKNIIPITSGETIFPKSNPNLNHKIFKGVNNFELVSPSIKKTKATIIAQNL